MMTQRRQTYASRADLDLFMVLCVYFVLRTSKGKSSV